MLNPENPTRQNFIDEVNAYNQLLSFSLENKKCGADELLQQRMRALRIAVCLREVGQLEAIVAVVDDMNIYNLCFNVTSEPLQLDAIFYDPLDGANSSRAVFNSEIELFLSDIIDT